MTPNNPNDDRASTPSLHVERTSGPMRSVEGREDIALAEKRLEDVRAGKSKTIPLDEVLKRYGVEG